ncbi:MAG TPA: tryptophan 7-halogenase [Planctomycetaceae bacterium]|jgi:FADH2 O2-dependent halogenase|nr:tryptophan 7-halogenase [Planctomycetaceae bacterium]
MREIDVDIAIIGAGFGGSLAALLAHQIGRSVVLVDRGKHPRFAIGESSTPMANLVLENLADRYALPWLKPFANYSSWKAAYPNIPVGLKRGFSYFHHRRGEPFRPDRDHHGELLVSASYGPDDADTQWLRADFDAFLVQQVVAAGIPYWEEVSLHAGTTSSAGWVLSGTCSSGEPVAIRARFVVDASGENGFLVKALQLQDRRDTLKTHSRTVFAHFEGIGSWDQQLAEAGGRIDEHPLSCDQSTLHHVFDGGWMWIIPFDHGITSAGWCLDPRVHPLDESVTPEDEWSHWMRQFPSIAEQLAKAVPISDGGRLRRTGRMQRRWGQAAGPNWALLPTASGFIDPLHSSGNAHTLIGLERLIRAWEEDWDAPRLPARMQDYDRRFQAEIEFIDGIVASGYAGFPDFDRFVAVTMFYFATAIWAEHQRRAGRPPSAYLCAEEVRFRTALNHAHRLVSDPCVSTPQLEAFVNQTFADINLAGLGDPARKRMYPYPDPRETQG